MTVQVSPRLSILNYYHFSFNVILLNGQVSSYMLLSSRCTQHTELLGITECTKQLILTTSLFRTMRGKI